MVVNEPVMGVEDRKQSAVDNTRHNTVAGQRSRLELPERVGEPTREAADCGKLMPGWPTIDGVRPEQMPDDAFVLHVLWQLVGPRQHMDNRTESQLTRGIPLVIAWHECRVEVEIELIVRKTTIGKQLKVKQGIRDRYSPPCKTGRGRSPTPGDGCSKNVARGRAGKIASHAKEENSPPRLWDNPVSIKD